MDPLSTCLLFEQFLAQRRYLKNVTPSTLEWYQTAFKALQKVLGADVPPLTKSLLQQFVVAIRLRGVQPVSCNTYIKALNAFCLWLHEEGHLAERLQLPLLKVPDDLSRVAASPAMFLGDPGFAELAQLLLDRTAAVQHASAFSGPSATLRRP